MSGNIPLDALVSDSIKVKRVVFQATGPSLHNAIIGTATPKSYGWVAVWDSTKVANGSYHGPKPSWCVLMGRGSSVHPFGIHVENKPAAS